MSGDTSGVGGGGDKWNVGVAALMAARQERFMCHFRFEHRMLSQIFNASTGSGKGVGRGKGWLLVCASEMATLHTHVLRIRKRKRKRHFAVNSSSSSSSPKQLTECQPRPLPNLTPSLFPPSATPSSSGLCCAARFIQFICHFPFQFASAANYTTRNERVQRRTGA